MCYSLAGIICILVKRMSKKVRIKDSYSDREFVGVEAIILSKNKGVVLVGFPLEGSIGWYDEDMSTSYNLWYISEEYLEPVQVFSKSKSK